MDDSTIIQKYEENGGHLCIRARTEQISPTITVRSFPMQRLAVFALAVWLVFAGGLVSEAVGQTDRVRTDSVAKTAVLKGKITKDSEPAFEVRISLFKANEFIFGCLTDEDGEFRIENIIQGTYDMKVSDADTTVIQQVKLTDFSTEEVRIELGHNQGTVGGAWFIGMPAPPIIDKNDATRRTTFNLQDIRRIPNNR
jgi:hypothetical protein